MRTLVRAAASSIASGIPSSRRTTRATCLSRSGCALPRAPARSTNSRTAGDAAIRSSDQPVSGSANGGTTYTVSPGTRSSSRLVARMTSFGQTSSNVVQALAVSGSTCSQLSSTSSRRRRPTCSAAASIGQVTRRRQAERGADRGHRVAHRRQRHPADTLLEPVADGPRRGQAQPRLADTTGTGEGKQPRPALGDQSAGEGQLRRPADQFVGRARAAGRNVVRARSPWRWAAAVSWARSAARSRNASPRRRKVCALGARRLPRSRAAIASALTPARSASPSCDNPASRRCRRSRSPNVAPCASSAPRRDPSDCKAGSTLSPTDVAAATHLQHGNP